MKRKYGHNIIIGVRSKELGRKNLARINHRIIRHIICQDDVRLKQVWEKQSSSLTFYDSNRLYFDNYRTCYTWCGFNGKPSPLYKLPDCSSKVKIEDALVCQYHPEEVSEINRPHLIVLTKDNWIKRCDLNTGRELQSVYLHSKLHYNYLSWNEEGFSFVVKSTKSQSTSLMRAADVQCNILLTMAIFTIYPLELKACMEVDKRVFGTDTTGAHLDGGNILFTTHQRGIVRFYSFERILQQHESSCNLRLGDDFPNGDADGCKIGQSPLGIPITLRLTGKPEVLFEVRCFDHDVKFGGFPWHFMVSPPTRNPSEIKVYSLANKEEAINGTLERNIVAANAGMPPSYFHFDGSDRIVNTKMRTLSVMKFKQNEDGRSELVQDHVISPWPYRDDRELEREMKEMGTSLSRSGRLIKYRQWGLWDDEEASMYEAYSGEMINNIGCETDLDVTTVAMATRSEEEDTYEALICHLTLHDNQTGGRLRTFRMPGEWDVTVEHHMSMDMDTLIHTFKNKFGKWVCQVFRFERKQERKEKSSKRKIKQRPVRSKPVKPETVRPQTVEPNTGCGNSKEYRVLLTAT